MTDSIDTINTYIDENLMEETYINQKFRGTWTIRRNLDTFDPRKYFSEYPYVKEYDPKIIYDCNYFDKDYGVGIKKYILNLYNIYQEKNKEQYYVVAMEILSSEDAKTLEKYCQCNYCNKHWLNPVKYFTCKCCVGCITSDMVTQDNINKARYVMANTS